MNLIEKTKDLADFCTRARGKPFVTVDTEFHRETTYWPELCLIQMAVAADDAVVVDARKDGLDLSPFYELLADEAVVKVFHAARQDVEIFHVYGGVIPKPLFDTQIAAMVCGHGDQAAYDTLVRKVTGKTLDKTSRFTDWKRRPLDDKQIAYAMADVTHLVAVYEALSAQLARSGRESWVAEEMAILTSASTYETDPDAAWRRMKGRASNRRALAILQRICAWRERLAQSRNTPRNRIMKDDAIWELVHQRPSTPEDIDRLRAVPRGFGRSELGKAVLAEIKAALDMPGDALPQLPAREERPKAPPAVVELLKVLLKDRSEREGVASRLIGSTSDLEELAANPEGENPLTQGWRRSVFGDDALALIAGKLSLRLHDGDLVIERTGA